LKFEWEIDTADLPAAKIFSSISTLPEETKMKVVQNQDSELAAALTHRVSSPVGRRNRWRTTK
jgi:hypothetical protein